MKKIISIVIVLATLACAPKLQVADIELPDSYLYNTTFSLDTTHISREWWRYFGDETLNSLEEQALASNRALASALASLNSSRHSIKVARAEYLPSLTTEIAGEKIHEEGATESEYSIYPTLSWELSLFGAMRSTKRYALAEYLATQSGARALMLSISSQVATAYFTLAQYQRTLELSRRSFELRLESAALVDSMFRYGMSDGTALMQAKSLVYSAKVEMERYERATKLATISLAELLSITPDRLEVGDCGARLFKMELPSQIPLALPSSLVEQRPDVMESYYKMEAAAANVGIKHSQRYPSIALTASGGVYSTAIDKLLKGNPGAWIASMELTAPIFKFGALKRAQMMAIESYNASLYDYEQSIIEAVAEVESALIEISTYRDQTTASAALVLANTKISENTTALYNSGLGDYLSVLDAERELYSSQIDMLAITAQNYINYVNLFKALGGGW